MFINSIYNSPADPELEFTECHSKWHYLNTLQNPYKRTFVLRCSGTKLVFLKIEFDEGEQKINVENIWKVHFPGSNFSDCSDRPQLIVDSIVAIYNRTAVQTGTIHICDAETRRKRSLQVAGLSDDQRQK